MLNLNCPNCGTPHRVDNAFRGGVARCDSCGALIHVPTKDGKPIESHGGRKKRPRTPDGVPANGRKGRRKTEAPGAAARRRFRGKPIAITLTILIFTLSAGACWLIYQTALKARGG